MYSYSKENHPSFCFVANDVSCYGSGCSVLFVPTASTFAHARFDWMCEGWEIHIVSMVWVSGVIEFNMFVFSNAFCLSLNTQAILLWKLFSLENC